jgi:hypothetical protein
MSDDVVTDCDWDDRQNARESDSEQDPRTFTTRTCCEVSPHCPDKYERSDDEERWANAADDSEDEAYEQPPDLRRLLSTSLSRNKPDQTHKDEQRIKQQLSFKVNEYGIEQCESRCEYSRASTEHASRKKIEEEEAHHAEDMLRNPRHKIVVAKRGVQSRQEIGVCRCPEENLVTNKFPRRDCYCPGVVE